MLSWGTMSRLFFLLIQRRPARLSPSCASSVRSSVTGTSVFIMQMPDIQKPTGAVNPSGGSLIKSLDIMMCFCEAALEDGRFAMLAALGYNCAEEFHRSFQ